MSSTEGRTPNPMNANDPTNEAIFRYFEYAHLPAQLRAVSEPFHDLALKMIQTLPRNAERSAGLRKLLEAKDCAVRAALPG